MIKNDIVVVVIVIVDVADVVFVVVVVPFVIFSFWFIPTRNIVLQTRKTT